MSRQDDFEMPIERFISALSRRLNGKAGHRKKWIRLSNG